MLLALPAGLVLHLYFMLLRCRLLLIVFVYKNWGENLIYNNIIYALETRDVSHLFGNGWAGRLCVCLNDRIEEAEAEATPPCCGGVVRRLALKIIFGFGLTRLEKSTSYLNFTSKPSMGSGHFFSFLSTFLFY